MKLLVVVDMQNDFVSGSLGSADAQAIVGNVAALIRAFDGEILYTMDTHLPDYLDTQEGRRLPVRHCIAGTEGWQLDPEIARALAGRKAADEAHMVVKGTFGPKDLPQRIQPLLGVDEPLDVTVVGLCTDICVISTALLIKAFYPEAHITVDASCCAGASREGHRTALAAMGPCQIDVIGA